MNHACSLCSFVGWGVTLIDSLDTMWIMGLHEYFYEAIPIVANMTFSLNEVNSELLLRDLARLISEIVQVCAIL